MNKYEKLIEHIINDDEAQARALFHQIVVEKSREIYESLMDEEYAEEDIHALNPVEDMVDEIQADETMQAEGDDPMDDDEPSMDDMGDEMGMDDMGDEMGGEQDLEAKVMDLESELEALKAEFEQLMGNEGGNDMDDMDFGADDEGMGDEDEEDNNMMAEASDDDDDDDDDEMTESVNDDDDDDDDDSLEESRSRQILPKTAVDLMREYVEKISAPSNTEFTPVGTGTGGDKPAGNTKNPLAGKNDMGGTAQNIAKGFSETAPDGQSPHGKVDGKLVKNAQEIDVAKRNVNKPGGNKGAQNWYSNKAGAKKGEGQTTDGSVPVQKKSIEPGGN